MGVLTTISSTSRWRVRIVTSICLSLIFLCEYTGHNAFHIFFNTIIVEKASCKAHQHAVKHSEIPLSITKSYNTSSGWNPNAPINLHLVAHSHDDVGWLVTVDQYYTGYRMNEFGGGVQFILDTVIEQLQENPDRKFMYVEIAFFSRWWREQSEEKKEIVRSLVKNGQFVFINGGWAMNDEASVHYVSTIDQMTRGHTFLLKEFGVRPRIGWHIDPFGHSSTQASLFAQMNFDAFFLGRIDHDDLMKRKKEKNLEFLWNACPNQKDAGRIFAAVMYQQYAPPPGFHLENDPPIVDDSEIDGYNIQEKVDALVQAAQQYAQAMRTNNVLFPMGEDFAYSNAIRWYKQMDKLIHYTNLDGRINVFYSNPEIYIDAVYSSGKNWTIKSDDFFPYSDGYHAYWTGYFTSRPALKYYERVGMGYLQACRQLEVFDWGNGNFTSESLEDAISLVQHHDGVSGTSKQAVANDYAYRISQGMSQCDHLINSALSHSLANHKSRLHPQPIKQASGWVLKQCNHLNISVCDMTQKAQDMFSLVAYNSLGMERCETIRLPVSFQYAAICSDGTLNPAIRTATALSIGQSTKNLRGDHNVGEYELSFVGCVPPLGYATFNIEERTTNTVKSDRPKNPINRYIVLENDLTEVTIDKHSGTIISIMKKGEIPIKVNMNQEFLYYRSSNGTSDDAQASGAYIFRPANNTPRKLMDPVVFKVELVGDEVQVKINEWVSQVIRLPISQQHVEVEMTIGPINIKDGIGKEIIARYSTDIASKDEFYTDANGREMQKRRIDYRSTWPLVSTESVSQNYYPINTRMYINSTNKQLTIVTDRSVGGTSLQEGQMEVMIHRRTLKDDGRGVGEPINEPGQSKSGGLVIRTVHFLLVESPESSANKHRPLSQRLTYPYVMAFSSKPLPLMSFSGLRRSLPSNIHIMTLKLLDQSTILLRIEHIYEKDEDQSLSRDVTIDLDDVFDPAVIGRVISIIEKSLSANSDGYMRSSRQTLWTNEGPMLTSLTNLTSNHEITLSPMQIRTFIVKVDRKSEIIS